MLLCGFQFLGFQRSHLRLNHNVKWDFLIQIPAPSNRKISFKAQILFIADHEILLWNILHKGTVKHPKNTQRARLEESSRRHSSLPLEICHPSLWLVIAIVEIDSSWREEKCFRSTSSEFWLRKLQLYNFFLHLTPKEGNRVEECFDNQVRRCNKFIISGPCKIDLSAPVADFFLSACVLCFFFLAAASRPVELHFELLCFMCRIPMNFHCKLRFGMPSEFRVSLALGVFFLFSDGKIEVFEIK